MEKFLCKKTAFRGVSGAKAFSRQNGNLGWIKSLRQVECVNKNGAGACA